jgi:hypothetical protein
MGSKRGSPKGSKDFPKCGGELVATSAPQAGIPSTVSSDVLIGAALRDPRHEAYAQALAGGLSYAAAYRSAGFADHGNAHKLAYAPDVAARVRMLQTAAAERVASGIAERIGWLTRIVNANPEELTRVVTQPCGDCWTDLALAAATVAYLASHGSPEAGEPPNTDAPRHDCERCSGDGISRVVLTPTAELSANARALFKAARQNAKGEIIVEMHDQLAAAAELSRMQPGAYAASRSLNANLNMNGMIPAARDSDYSIEELERLLESFKD